MRKNLLSTLLLMALAFYSNQSTAVHVAQNGLGEVLIYPYYTVNNDLNTLYTIVNTTDQPKALAIRFLEGDINIEVLTFHIYLDAYDTWTGALVPSTSTIGDHQGEPSGTHVTVDTSCAPYLIKAGQELLPFAIDQDSDDNNHNMQRAREGHIEVLEMGVLTGEPVEWVEHVGVGLPRNCAAIEFDWDEDNQWDSAELDPPTGGLKGSVALMNVGEGIAFSYDAVALKDFWQGGSNFAPVGDLEPNLNDAFPESTVWLDNGELMTTEWQDGYQAVSEVLTKASVIGEYALDAFINGKTDLVYAFPTKRFHVNNGTAFTPPFSSVWNGSEACESFKVKLWDREAQDDYNPYCGNTATKTGGVSVNLTPRPPCPDLPAFCKATNVVEPLLPGSATPNQTSVLGSDNAIWVVSPHSGVTESGWMRMTFPEAQATTPDSGVPLAGMPVIAFAFQQYTNGGAAQGLLAQYGVTSKQTGLIRLSTDTED